RRGSLQHGRSWHRTPVGTKQLRRASPWLARRVRTVSARLVGSPAHPARSESTATPSRSPPTGVGDDFGAPSDAHAYLVSAITLGSQGGGRGTTGILDRRTDFGRLRAGGLWAP